MALPEIFSMHSTDDGINEGPSLISRPRGLQKCMFKELFTYISICNPYVHIALLQIPTPTHPSDWGGGVGVGGWRYLKQRYMDIWIADWYVNMHIFEHAPCQQKKENTVEKWKISFFNKYVTILINSCAKFEQIAACNWSEGYRVEVLKSIYKTRARGLKITWVLHVFHHRYRIQRREISYPETREVKIERGLPPLTQARFQSRAMPMEG